MSELKILYEDNHILVAEKPPGIPVQSDQSGDRCFMDEIKYYLKKKYNKPGNVYLGLVHRLDRPVGGVMVFARTTKAMTRLSEDFKNKRTEKEYLAVVCQKPIKPKDTIKNYLKKDSRNNKTKVYNKMIPGSKEALLEYEWLADGYNYSLLKIKLHTGRHHQIRAQLSHIGCPIKGDIKYGAPRTNPSPFIHLHAWHLSFYHPTLKNKMEFFSYPSYPDPLWYYFNNFMEKNF
jgi:23S rRNA pseudouridine1911/1915/1917 synthase